MKRFVYSPDVNAYIAMHEGGIADVSEDIISGSVTRRTNAASNAMLTLQNPRRKYLRKFKPMDRIAIYLTRVKPMLVFTGYLDEVDIEQLYPAPITLTASCTLKRLLYTYWDPSLPYTQRFFQKHGWNWDIVTGNIFDPSSSLWNMDIQNSIGSMMRVVINEVGGWPIGREGEGKNTIHIMSLPKAFVEKTHKMIASAKDEIEQEHEDVTDFLKDLLTVEGITSDPNADDNPSFDFTSKRRDVDPLPQTRAGQYKAKIYGPSYQISGFIAALKKEAAKVGINLGAVQLNAAQTIFQTARSKGYDAEAAAGWVAASWPESSLTPTKDNPTNTASGLFQLLSSGFFGPNGMLAKAIREVNPGYNGSPQKGGPESHNAQYNTLAIMRPENVSNGTHCLPDGTSVQFRIRNVQEAITYINNSTKPYEAITDIFIRPSCPEKLSNNYPAGAKMYGAAKRAITQSKETTGAVSGQGAVGDVKVGSRTFFHSKDGNRVGYTFRIKGNPYHQDDMIFRAVKYDAGLRANEISIYVPGAGDESTPQAQAWGSKWTHNITIETSAGQDQRFNPPDPAAPATQGNNENSDAVPAVVKVARAELARGVHETDGPNRGPRVNEYLHYANSTPGQPWCAAFVSWCFGKTDHPIIKTAGAKTIYDWVTGGHGQAVNRVVPGDLIAYNVRTPSTEDDHIGIVETVNKDGSFTSIEGNYSDKVARVPHSPGELGGRISAARVDGVSSDTSTPSAAVTSNQTYAQGADATGVLTGQETMTAIAESVSIGLPLVFPLASDSFEAVNMRGERALQNDVKLMEWVEFMCKAAGRHFQSLPNGDFIAFYPDHFNWSGENPYWRIADIETIDLTIKLSDTPLATHVFTTADIYRTGQIDLADKMSSTVASVESIGTFRDLIDAQEFNVVDFLRRYGPRPLEIEAPEIKSSFMQFMYGWRSFLDQWAELLTANPTFTFMPELYPGGLIEFDSKDLIMYIESVTHNFDRSGGFTTTAELTAPHSRGFSYSMVLFDRGYSNNPPRDPVTTTAGGIITGGGPVLP